MSEDNMEELKRYRIVGNGIVEDDNGVVVRFSDVAEREARFQARIEELEAELDRLAEMDERHAMTAVRQSEMIDAAEKLADALKAKWDARNDALKHGVLGSTATEHDELIRAYRAFRSLLDSGEEQGRRPETRKEPRCREHGHGPDEDGQCFQCGDQLVPVEVMEAERKSPSWACGCPCHAPGAKGEPGCIHCRATPSPALEGREEPVCDECQRRGYPLHDQCTPGHEAYGRSAPAATTDCVPSPGGGEDEYPVYLEIKDQNERNWLDDTLDSEAREDRRRGEDSSFGLDYLGAADALLTRLREAGLSPDRDNENAYRRDPDGCYVCGVDEYAARARGRVEAGLSPDRDNERGEDGVAIGIIDRRATRYEEVAEEHFSYSRDAGRSSKQRASHREAAIGAQDAAREHREIIEEIRASSPSNLSQETDNG